MSSSRSSKLRSRSTLRAQEDSATNRGFVTDDGAVVRGDSGRVFSLGIPDNVGVSDIDAAMQEIAELLLAR